MPSPRIKSVLPKMQRRGYERPRLRRSKPLCRECGSQPDRVEGPECVLCGLAYAPDETRVRAETEARRAPSWL